VEHGKSGFLVPEKDPRALAERIIYLLEHADLWLEMGRHGRRNVERNFNQEALNARLEEVFKELTFSP
jgi:colanic acid/amylovoran biosynthesis glycosyltransferase